MKIKLAILCLIICCCSSLGWAQVDLTAVIQTLVLDECPIQTEPPLKKCTPIVLETQEHIDAFRDVRVVKGNLQIEAEENLNFGPLNNLREIYGILRIHVGSLSTIHGFNNLESVGSRAAVRGNADQIYIENNPNLTSIVGFQKLKISTHQNARSPKIFIRFNNSLTQIDGFGSLDHAGVISIRRNPLLNSISGFTSLHTLDSGIGLQITDSPLLTSVPSFANLQTIRGSFEFWDLRGLATLPTFPMLSSVRDVRIHNTASAEIAGFNNSGLQGIRRIILSNNRNLTLISGFANVRSITGERGDFYVSNNPILNNVTGFNSLITNDSTDYISITDNADLDCPEEFFMLQDVAVSTRNLVNCETTPYEF